MDGSGHENVVPTTIELILINVDDASSLTVSTDENDKITWDGGSGEAYIREKFGNSILISSIENPRDTFLGLTLPDTLADIAEFFFRRNDNWLHPISGEKISQGANTDIATVNVSNDANIPLGSIREAIESDREIVITDYESQSEKELMVRAARTLIHGADAVIRGDLVISRFPYRQFKGALSAVSGTTITLGNTINFDNAYVKEGNSIRIDGSNYYIESVSGNNSITLKSTPPSTASNYELSIMTRTGHSVYIADIPSTNIGNQAAIVTKIEYTEAPGDWTSKIEVLLHVTGRGEGGKLSLLKSIAKQAEEASFQTPAQTGQATPVIDPINAKWLYDGVFTPVGTDRLEWTNPGYIGDPNDPDDLDGDGTLTLTNGSEFTIRGYNPNIVGSTVGFVENIPSDVATYLYYDTGTNTGEFESTTDTAVLISNPLIVPIAWMRAGTNRLDFILFGLTFQKQDDEELVFDESIVDWATDIRFSITDAMADPMGVPLDSVSWTSGTIYFAGGMPIGNVLAGTVPVGSERIWLYFDKNSGPDGAILSTTTIQEGVGLGKLTLATAARNPTDPNYPNQLPINLYVYNSSQGVVIDGGLLIANTIAGNKIVANTITATEIRASTISVDKLVSNLHLGSDHRIITGGVLQTDGSYLGRRLTMEEGGIVGYNSAGTREFAIINGAVSYTSDPLLMNDATILLGENNEVAINKTGMYLSKTATSIFPTITFYSSGDSASISATESVANEITLRIQGGSGGLLLETQGGGLNLSGLEQISSPGTDFRLLGVETLTGGAVKAIQIGNLGTTGILHIHTDTTDSSNANTISVVDLSASNSLSTPRLILGSLGQVTNPGSAFRLLGVATATGGTVQAIEIGNLGITATGTGHTHEYSTASDNTYQENIDVNNLDFYVATTFDNVAPANRRFLGIDEEITHAGQSRRVRFFSPDKLFTSTDPLTIGAITASSIDISSHITVPVTSLNATDTPSFLLGILGTRDQEGTPVYMGRVYSFELSELISSVTHTHEYSTASDNTYQENIDVNNLDFYVATTFDNVAPANRRFLGIDEEITHAGQSRRVRFFSPDKLFTSTDPLTIGAITASSIDISSHITVPVTSLNATDTPSFLLGILGTRDQEGTPVYMGRVYSFELSELISSVTHTHEYSTASDNTYQENIDVNNLDFYVATTFDNVAPANRRFLGIDEEITHAGQSRRVRFFSPDKLFTSTDPLTIGAITASSIDISSHITVPVTSLNATDTPSFLLGILGTRDQEGTPVYMGRVYSFELSELISSVTHTHEYSTASDNTYQENIDVNNLDFYVATTFDNVAPANRRFLGIDEEITHAGQSRRVRFFSPDKLFTSTDPLTIGAITASSIDISSHITVPVTSLNATDTPSFLLGILGTRDQEGTPVYMGRVYSFELSELISSVTHTHEYSTASDNTYQENIDVNNLDFYVATTFDNVAPANRRFLGIDEEITHAGQSRRVRFFSPDKLFTSTDPLTIGAITASSIDISSHITVPVTSLNATDTPSFLLGILGTRDQEGTPVYMGRVYSFELSELISSVTHTHEYSTASDNTYQENIDVNNLDFYVATTFDNVAPANRRFLGIDEEITHAGQSRRVRFFSPDKLFTSTDPLTIGAITASSIDISSHITVPVTSLNATDTPSFLLGILGTRDQEGTPCIYG